MGKQASDWVKINFKLQDEPGTQFCVAVRNEAIKQNGRHSLLQLALEEFFTTDNKMMDGVSFSGSGNQVLVAFSGYGKNKKLVHIQYSLTQVDCDTEKNELTVEFDNINSFAFFRTVVKANTTRFVFEESLKLGCIATKKEYLSPQTQAGQASVLDNDYKFVYHSAIDKLLGKINNSVARVDDSEEEIAKIIENATGLTLSSNRHALLSHSRRTPAQPVGHEQTSGAARCLSR